MSRNKKILIGPLGVVGARRDRLRERRVHMHDRHDGRRREDLEAGSRGHRVGERHDPAGATDQRRRAVSAGNVVELNVREGDVVKKGQVLMQIDPRNLQDAGGTARRRASPPRGPSSRSRRSRLRARELRSRSPRPTFKRQEGLMKSGLTSREDVRGRAESDMKMRTASLAQGEQSIKTQEDANLSAGIEPAERPVRPEQDAA